MNKKKTVNLQLYVAKVAEEKANLMFGGNFSSYVNWLIYKENKEDIEKLIQDMKEKSPKITGNSFKAAYQGRCFFCNKQIKKGDEINQLLFKDGGKTYIHSSCCDKYDEFDILIDPNKLINAGGSNEQIEDNENQS